MTAKAALTRYTLHKTFQQQRGELTKERKGNENGERQTLLVCNTVQINNGTHEILENSHMKETAHAQ